LVYQVVSFRWGDGRHSGRHGRTVHATRVAIIIIILIIIIITTTMFMVLSP